MENIGRRLGLHNSFIVEGNGKASGLALYWSKEICMEHCWNTYRIICCKVKNYGRETCWNLILSYGPPYPNEKKMFWELLEQRIMNCKLPWVVIGNLNEIEGGGGGKKYMEEKTQFEAIHGKC